jgi:hypothetical protein
MENTGWLILSAVVFPLVVVVVGYLLKKGIDKSFKGWEKYNDLREKNLLDWQTTWQAKVCQIKGSVDELDERLVSCVEYNDLHELSNEATGLKIRVTTLEEKTKNTEKYIEENKSNIKELFNRCGVCERRKVVRIDG